MADSLASCTALTLVSRAEGARIDVAPLIVTVDGFSTKLQWPAGAAELQTAPFTS